MKKPYCKNCFKILENTDISLKIVEIDGMHINQHSDSLSVYKLQIGNNLKF